MTCVIAVAEEGKICIGSDSAGSNDWTTRPVCTEKVFRVGDLIIGYTDSYRLGQILRYKLALPQRLDNETDEHYIQSSFLEVTRDCLKSNGYASIESNKESGGVFAVGYKGKAYTVQEDFSIISHSDGLEIIGFGQLIAMGAMAALEALPPALRITKALEIVHRFQPNAVLPPFYVVEG